MLPEEIGAAYDVDLGGPLCHVESKCGPRAIVPGCGPEQKLFPHFGKTRTAIFAVKQVEYDRHDRPRGLVITAELTNPSARET